MIQEMNVEGSPSFFAHLGLRKRLKNKIARLFLAKK
jgi:hypothetical protein